MFITWGKKTVIRGLGYVADFCPICREATAFKLLRIGSASHVYNISVGEGELVGHQRICHTCGTTFQANPAQYAAIAKKIDAVPSMVHQTFPNFNSVYQRQLATEEKIRLAPTSFSVEDRRALIRHPFALLSNRVEHRFSGAFSDREVYLSLLAAIVLPPVFAAIVRAIFNGMELMIFFYLLGLLFVIWQMKSTGSRYIRRQIIPLLAKNLRALNPTEKELQEVRSELIRDERKIGAKLRVRDLLAAITVQSGSVQG